MVRYKQDQNRVIAQYESGTYGVTSGNGVWIGQVTEHSMEDIEGFIETRFVGAGNRSYGQLIAGPRDVTGTVTYAPQDMRLIFYAIGSVASSQSASTGNHRASQINTGSWLNAFASGTGQFNSPTSFTIEDSKYQPITDRNSIRTIRGCIPDSVTLTLAQGEKATVEMTYIGQNAVYTSGTRVSTINTATSGVTPYLWNNAVLTLAGSTIETAREISLEIANNLAGPHYINGSRVIATPFVGDREITLNVTTDLDSNIAAMLYENIYKGGSMFNATLDLNVDVATVGSQHANFVFSGCKIFSIEMPSTADGVSESALVIRPQNISATEFSIGSTYLAW